MAAGKGTRMNNPAMAKVMFPVGDVPMIHHVVQLALDCDAERIIAIIGYNRESVRQYVHTIVQKFNASGRAHAVAIALRQGLVR